MPSVTHQGENMEKKTDFVELVEKVLKGFNPSEDRMKAMESEIKKLKSAFWRHEHTRRGWNKGAVTVEAHEWD